MKPPFDIAGDLDTPVSAFMKLKAFKPSFLLESVEGGERLGRYSFIGLPARTRIAARRFSGSNQRLNASAKITTSASLP